jgi:prophage regulatory protein
VRLLSRADLQAMGFRWTKNHFRKLVRAGRFPEPIRIGPKTLCWSSDEIEQWLTDPARREVPEVQTRTGSQVQEKARANRAAKAAAKTRRKPRRSIRRPGAR